MTQAAGGGDRCGEDLDRLLMPSPLCAIRRAGMIPWVCGAYLLWITWLELIRGATSTSASLSGSSTCVESSACSSTAITSISPSLLRDLARRNVFYSNDTIPVHVPQPSRVAAVSALTSTFRSSSTSSSSSSSRSPTSSRTSGPSAMYAQTAPTLWAQEALPVVDSSYSHLKEAEKMFQDERYGSIFEKDLFLAVNNTAKEPDSQPGKDSLIHQVVTPDATYVETVASANETPFLFTGKSETRTKNNCYVVQAKEGLKEEQLSKISDVLKAIGGDIRHAYTAAGMEGFSVCFPENQLPLAILRALSGIKSVERDQYVNFDQVQDSPPWQLSRIGSVKNSLNGQFVFNRTGSGVNVYVIDSGVKTSHPEFGGRAKVGYSAFKDFPDDCAGHGTQVTSVIGGTNVGVAKLVNIIVAQVLDCAGQGENTAVLAALNWIIKNHTKPAIINMSVGGPRSPTVDSAVRAAVNGGIPVVVAAGNSQIDACGLTPSGIDVAMVVGASTSDNKRATFSNYGACVDLFAPGKQIVCAAIPSQANTNGFILVSGTSLSAPIVTGIYALLLEKSPNASPAELKEMLLKESAKGILDDTTLKGTANILAQCPAMSRSGGVEVKFLPAGTLPSLSMPNGGISPLEIALICVAAGLGCIVAILIVFVAIRRFLRSDRRRGNDIPIENKAPSVFR